MDTTPNQNSTNWAERQRSNSKSNPGKRYTKIDRSELGGMPPLVDMITGNSIAPSNGNNLNINGAGAGSGGAVPKKGIPQGLRKLSPNVVVASNPNPDTLGFAKESPSGGRGRDMVHRQADLTHRSNSPGPVSGRNKSLSPPRHRVSMDAANEKSPDLLERDETRSTDDTRRSYEKLLRQSNDRKKAKKSLMSKTPKPTVAGQGMPDEASPETSHQESSLLPPIHGKKPAPFLTQPAVPDDEEFQELPSTQEEVLPTPKRSRTSTAQAPGERLISQSEMVTCDEKESDNNDAVIPTRRKSSHKSERRKSAHKRQGAKRASKQTPSSAVEDDAETIYLTATDAQSETGDNAPNTQRKAHRIRVAVRKRPLADFEVGGDCVEVTQPACVLLGATKQRVDLTEYTESHNYVFDDAFSEQHRNEAVYNRCCKTLIDCVFEGGSASCFAYGQTGSGKTYTMIGTESEPGLYVLAAKDIFDRAQSSHRVFVSLYEIYCNSLFDLLNHRAVVVTREDANKRVNVCGLTWHEIASVKDLIRVIDRGTIQRRTGSTSANEFSSRSHAILTISLRDENSPKFLGALNVVDLAGSERAADTAANDKQTRLEGAEINKSLLALKECIRGLDERKKHIPFRGSKLTEVLRDSFTGNSRTVMIATISPSEENVEHTLNTLRYAFRVKGLSVECVEPSKQRNAPRPQPVPVVTRTKSVEPVEKEKKRKKLKDRIRSAQRRRQDQLSARSPAPSARYGTLLPPISGASPIPPDKKIEEMHSEIDELRTGLHQMQELKRHDEERMKMLEERNMELLRRIDEITRLVNPS